MIADLDVLQELPLAHEFLATDLAGIWLPLAVHKVMNVAILGATELLAADLAAEVLGACVAQQMLLQVNGITEGGLTVFAVQIAQLHVHRLDMIVQQSLPLEAALACVALVVGPVKVRDIHVCAPVGALGKGRVADFTLVGPFSGMDAFVLDHLDATVAHLIAVRAGEQTSRLRFREITIVFTVY